MNPIEAAQVESFLIKHASLTLDQNARHGAYFVNSLYFDTPQMSDYREKDGSFLIRKKVRARMYESAWHDGLERVWLEVKHKRNMNIKKTRAVLHGDAWRQFIAHNDPLVILEAAKTAPESERADLMHFAHTYLRQNYRPIGVVRYKRKAYVADFTSPVRITFDFDVMTSRFETAALASNLTPVSHQGVIMEVKFNNKLPWWFKHLLSSFDLRRTDFSKYRNSLAVLRGSQRIPISK